MSSNARETTTSALTDWASLIGRAGLAALFIWAGYGKLAYLEANIGYMKAYGEALSHTSSEHAPWYVVPADDKRNARLIVSQVIVDALAALKMNYPARELDGAELVRIRNALGED